jgi:hypothetical protein
MDDNIKRKPRAISARPVVRPSAAPASVALAPAPAPSAEAMQVIESGAEKSTPSVKTYIERQLKSVYDDVLNQPIPDRFLNLLDALEERVTPAGDNDPKARKEGQE